MQELYIKHNSGELSIFLDTFFPTSKTRLNKLLKIINLDSNHEELKRELEVYFHHRILICEKVLPEFRDNYLEFKQKEADTQRLVNGGKHPSGVLLTKDELKQAKKDLREYNRLVKSALSDSKKLTREKEQFLRLLECL